jgi:gliding motility-associated-like protein
VGTRPVSAAVISKGGSVVLTLDALPEGTDVVSVMASIGGCLSGNLDSTVTVKVNGAAKIDYNVTGSTVCKGFASTVTIDGSEIGDTYQAFLAATGAAVSGSIQGTGNPITIPVNPSPGPVDTILIKAFVVGCGVVNLENKGIIITNDNSTSKTLPTKGSVACINDSTTTATILGAKLGITYTAYKDQTSLGTLVGNGGDLVFIIPVAKLSSGKNSISFIATVDGCNPVKLDSNAIVYILGERKVISGVALVCDSSQGTYSIDPVVGVTTYDWTVPVDASILSGQGTPSIVVKFGKTSGLITVSPIGNKGDCNAVKSSLQIDVEPHLNAKIKISGLDTVCLNGKDRIYIDSTGIVGVDAIFWTWSSGIEVLDTIHKTAVYPMFDVSYFQVGTQIITATPREKCSNTFGATDTLRVAVLAIPAVEAGANIDVQNNMVTPIPLNGTGSSTNIPPSNAFTYLWSSLDPKLQIANSTSLNGASLTPLEGNFKVYLTVSNFNRCPARDSVLVSIKADIIIPNVFSPNGDGTHDTWEIRNLNSIHPNVEVQVFNQWGSLVFKSNGYSKPWDGTRNGESMPVATYYYVIDYKNGDKPHVSSVTIIR